MRIWWRTWLVLWFVSTALFSHHRPALAASELRALDLEPLGERAALILIPGIQEGPQKDYFRTFLSRLHSASGGELKKRFKLFLYVYDYSEESFIPAGKSLARLIEGNAELRARGVKIRIVAHSQGGLIALAALLKKPRPILQVITLGTPYQGTYLADREMTAYAIQKSGLSELSPLLTKVPWEKLSPLIFTDGGRERSLPPSLSPKKNLPLADLQKRAVPYRARFFGYAGELPARSSSWIKKHLDLLEFLLSGYLFNADAGFKQAQLYQVPARLIEQFGARSDGIVPTPSALSIPLKAHQRIFAGYNHRELVDGRDDLLLAQRIWRDLGATQDELLGIEFGEALAQLPSLPDLQIFWPPMGSAEVFFLQGSQLWGSDLALENRFSLAHLLKGARFLRAGEGGVLLSTEEGSWSRTFLVREGEIRGLSSLFSRCANWLTNKVVVFQIQDQLIWRNLETGQSRVLLKGVRLDQPPLILGRYFKVIYFLSQGNLYRIRPWARAKTLSDLKPLRQGVFALSRWFGQPVCFVREGEGFRLEALTAKKIWQLSLKAGKESGVSWQKRTIEITVASLSQVKQIVWHQGWLYLEVVTGEGPTLLVINLGSPSTWRSLELAEKAANQFGYTLGLDIQPALPLIRELPGVYELSINPLS